MDKTKDIVIKALKSCKAYSRRRILYKASRLSAQQRLPLIEHFNIEPQELLGKIVLFWSQITSNKVGVDVAITQNLFTES